MDNNINQINSTLPSIGIRRESLDYTSYEKARFWGEIDGYNGENSELQVRAYKSYFERLKIKVQISLLEHIAEIKAFSTTIDKRLDWLKSKLHIVQNKRFTKKELEKNYSIFDGFVYTGLGIIFLLAELAISMKTVANGLGMDIETSKRIFDPFHLQGYQLILELTL